MFRRNSIVGFVSEGGFFEQYRRCLGKGGKIEKVEAKNKDEYLLKAIG